MWNTKVIIKSSVAQARYTTALVRGNTETRNGKAEWLTRIAQLKQVTMH